MVFGCKAFNVKRQQDVFIFCERQPNRITHVYRHSPQCDVSTARLRMGASSVLRVTVVISRCEDAVEIEMSPACRADAVASIIYAPAAPRTESHMQRETSMHQHSSVNSCHGLMYHLLIYLLLYWKSMLPLHYLKHLVFISREDCAFAAPVNKVLTRLDGGAASRSELQK